jgi:undecaprenyl-diphosphatase
MNLYLFKLINGMATKSLLFDKIMIASSKYGPYVFMFMIIIVFLLGIVKNKGDYRKVAFSTVAFTVINLIINLTIRSIFHVDRPFVHNKVNLLVPHDTASSFPSNHATGTMSIALGLEKYNRILGLILTILSIVVGFSRVYVGNHYPMDVIGAYIIVFITNYLYNLLLRNKVEELYTKIEKLLIDKLDLKNPDENILNN